MRILGRFLLAAATGLVMVLGGFAVWERTAAPGNRFLILQFIAIGILLCVPLAIAAACRVLLRPGSHSPQALSPTGNGLF